MHPHHWYYGHRCGRATSRLFWFIVGAGTATWWHAHKAHQGWYEARHCGRDRIPQNAYPAPGAPGPSGPMQAQDQQQQPAPGTIDKWDREQAPEKDVVQQATDTITELSEATLNNLLVTVESLKAKLAEHRAQREQQDRELQALREAKFKQFEEWQRQQEKQKNEPPKRLV
ncbi:hypothetical protein C8Q74DRAFT_1346947 [Fomes fomentarius]|nr:hypothetical protein C8Q74DRAFT_1346947 [Fomes fomentarius]